MWVGFFSGSTYLKMDSALCSNRFRNRLVETSKALTHHVTTNKCPACYGIQPTAYPNWLTAEVCRDLAVRRLCL
jgi:hypothetical protein